MSSVANKEEGFAWDLLDGADLDCVAVRQESAVREAQQSVSNLHELYRLHPLQYLDVWREAHAREKEDWKDTAFADLPREHESETILDALGIDVTEDQLAEIHTAFRQQVMATYRLTWEDARRIALQVIADQKESAAMFTMDTVATVPALEPEEIKVCLLDDERGRLMTLEPDGITLTRSQAMRLIAKMAEAAGIMQDLEAQSVAAKAGAWVVANLPDAVKPSIDITIAARIEALANEHGVNDNDLQKILRVTGPKLVRLMQGLDHWNTDHIGLFADHIGMDPFEIVGVAK